MTIQSWSTRVRHDSDAMYREWGLEWNTKLAAIGLIQTADTGQANWATITRPAVNTNNGYEIWRFNDASQATAPVYIRFDYGTGTNANGPRIQVTVGTGSNGTGTITGTAITTIVSIASSGTQTTDTLRNSYMCFKDGNLGINWKQNAGAGCESIFVINRTTDSAGAPTVTGALVFGAAIGVLIFSQSLRYAATAVAYAQQGTVGTMQLCLWPQNRSTSLVGSDIQAALCFTVTPRIEPVMGCCGVLDSEFTTGNTFVATLVGTTARTYIALNGSVAFMDANARLKPAILWEA